MTSILRNFYLLFMIGALAAVMYGYSWVVIYNDYSTVELKASLNSDGFYYLVVPMLAIWAFFIAFSERDRKSDYGNARWAKTKDIQEMGLFAQTGIIYGLWGSKFIRTKEPLSALVAAPPGTGKTVAIVIPNLLSCNNSMIVNDPKNELFEKTADFRAKHQKVLRFAPAEKGSAQFNPFDEMPNDEIEIYTFIDRIAGILYPYEIGSKEIHWQKQAGTLFKTFCFQMLLYDLNDFKMNFANIRKSILSGSHLDKERPSDVQKGLLYDKVFFQASNMNGVIFEKFIENANLILNISQQELSSIITTTINALNSFDNPTVEQNTQSSDFKLSDFRKEKITLYLSSRPKDLNVVAPITKILIELFAIEILSDKPKDDEIITFLLDEFPKMGKMQELVKLPAVSRGQKANVIFICQDFDQIESVYKKTGLNELISTTAYKIVFTQNNYNTMKMVSDLIGKKTEEKQSTTRQTGQFLSSKSNQLSQEGKPLILPENVGMLKANEVIIIAQGHNTTPILAKSARFFKIREFKKRCVA